MAEYTPQGLITGTHTDLKAKKGRQVQMRHLRARGSLNREIRLKEKSGVGASEMHTKRQSFPAPTRESFQISGSEREGEGES